MADEPFETGAADVIPLPGRLTTEPKPLSAHLVGVCGSGMRGLAELMHGLGWNLSGSDLNPPPESIQSLMRRGFAFHQGHAAEHVPPNVDVLIFSPAIPASNSERMIAGQRGQPELSYTQMLGALMHGRRGVCIAGTHGKSTTTAMTATILTDAGLSPSAIFGAERCDTGCSAWGGDGDLFVVESCEFQRSFLEFTPQYAAILSVEPDHFDCFNTHADMIAAFGEFASQVRPDGLLLTRAEDAAARVAAGKCPAPVITFGWTMEADWWAGDIRRTGSGTRFRAFRRGQFVTEITLPLKGKHNVLNALAAAAMCFEIGVSPAMIRHSLAEFPGIRRRFEELGSWRGVTLMDDYAHHPTAVAATLEAAREKFGRRRLCVAFQPHQISRTTALMEEFSQCFHAADCVWITPVFAARECVTDEPQTVAEELVQRLCQQHVSAEFSPSLDQLVTVLEDKLRPGDVFLTMGAGDIDQVHHAFTRRFSRDSAPQREFGTLHLAQGGRPRTVLPHSA
ncbi:MAG: UDP-N-acetylmuramate--L-alanine ligase [Planctomycetaceae bacterium]|nr:UDP-N-acetylmuramate--L-alanine ligase [Planctomycetaceae bacterium]